MTDPLKPVTLSGKPSRPPAVLLHGFMGCAEDWQAAADSLGTTHHVLAINLPGHGPGWTPASVAALDMDACVDAIAAHLAELEGGPPALMGYSMGGRVALHLTMRHPDLVARLVLESASPGLKTAAQRENRRAQDEALAARLRALEPGGAGFRAFLEEWYRLPLFASLQAHPNELAKLIDRRCAQCDPSLLAEALIALGTGSQPNLWPKLHALATPTLVLTGELDRKYRVIAEDMALACPAMAAEILTGCGHNVHLENPAAYLTVVRAFLSPPG